MKKFEYYYQHIKILIDRMKSVLAEIQKRENHIHSGKNFDFVDVFFIVNAEMYAIVVPLLLISFVRLFVRFCLV